jgi:hypothetical protein
LRYSTACLDRHVADRHPPFHRERFDRGARELDGIAGRARGADLADDGEHDVLGRCARRQYTVHRNAHVLRPPLDQRLGREHVLHFGCPDAMGNRAERAMRRRVAVAAHDRRARQREALLGPDHVDDALPLVATIVVLDAEVAAVLLHVGELLAALRIFGRLRPITGRDVVVGDGECQFRAAHATVRHAQAFERLRARHLVDEVAVDEQHARPVRLLADDMGVENLVVERLRAGCRGHAAGLLSASCRRHHVRCCTKRRGSPASRSGWRAEGDGGADICPPSRLLHRCHPRPCAWDPALYALWPLRGLSDYPASKRVGYKSCQCGLSRSIRFCFQSRGQRFNDFSRWIAVNASP